jgi:phosphoribosylformylglycinamidine cyclo-ligase
VNDILAQGAKPLFFLDYIASGKLVPETVASIVEGLATACEENGCALIGGETAEMPGFYKDEEYDLAGVIIGVVEQERIINGSGIKEGDVIIGLPSSGMHTNGYSLARKVFFDDLKLKVDDNIPELARTTGEELLKVHRSYLKPVGRLLDEQLVSGIAHITGGGFEGNISRVMPAELTAEVDTKTWEPLPVFRFIREKGRISSDEMYCVFNMGIGMVILMREEALGKAGELLEKENMDFKVIGRVIKGVKPVKLLGI